MRAADGSEALSFAEEEVAPYIAFENVCKSFGDFVVLKDVSFYVKLGRDAVHSGAKRCGEVGIAADLDGISEGRTAGR